MLLMLRICSNKDEGEKELELGKEEVCMDVWGASYKSHLQRRWQEEEGWSERLINYADLYSIRKAYLLRGDISDIKKAGLDLSLTQILCCWKTLRCNQTTGNTGSKKGREGGNNWRARMKTFAGKPAELLTGPAGWVLCVGAEVLHSHITGPHRVLFPISLHCPPVVQRSTCLKSSRSVFQSSGKPKFQRRTILLNVLGK